MHLSNIVVEGAVKRCSDAPLDGSGTCIDACYSAHVTSDGSYSLTCLGASDTVGAGACAPLIGSVAERCESSKANDDEGCNSGKRCL